MSLIYDAGYNIYNLVIDWTIGGDPELNWSAPAKTPHHIIIWRAETIPDWSSATAIDTIAGTETSYTDTSASADGTIYYYWPVGYDTTGNYAGRTYGVAAWQNTLTYFGGGQESGSGTQQSVNMGLFKGGFFRSSGAFTFSSCTTGPDGIGEDNPALAGMQIYVYNSTPPSDTNNIAGFVPSGYSIVPFPPSPGSTGGGGSGYTIPFGLSDPVAVQHDIGGPAIYGTNVIGLAGLPSVPPNTTWDGGTIDGLDISATVAYLGPQGQAGPGGATPGPAPPVNILPPGFNPPINMNDVCPTVLPCIPCCKTAYPICDCGKP